MSFPKSGRTWLRVMVGHVLCRRCGVEERRMLETAELCAGAGLEPLQWTHAGAELTSTLKHGRLETHPEAYEGRAVLMLVRHPCDVLVSLYFQATTRRGLFKGTLGEFLGHPGTRARDWVEYHQKWWEARGSFSRYHALTYEALHADPVGSLRGVLRHLGLESATDGEVAAAVEYGRFEHMRELEVGGFFRDKAMRPGMPGDPESLKTRRGRIGGYADYLMPEQVERIRGELAGLDCPWIRAYAGAAAG